MKNQKIQINEIKKKSVSGITLIALVITIIVLLILAGISISMLSGDNSILQKATDAKEQTGIGQEKEIVALAYNSALAKKVGNGDSTAITAEDLNKELSNQGATADGSSSIKVTFTSSKRQYTVNNGIVDYAGIKADNPAGNGLDGLSDAEVALLPTGVTEKSIENISNENLKDDTKIKAVITDIDNGEVPIPKGANYKEGTESTGLVIEYKGSEFVWVPVPVTVDNLLYPKGTTKAMAKMKTGDNKNYEGIVYNFSTESYTYGNYGNIKSVTYTAITDPQPIGCYEPTALQDTSNGDWATYEPGSDPRPIGLYLIKEYITGYSTKTNEQIKTDWLEQLKMEYNLMIDSVKKYGGFFVGRYETSIDSTTGVASKYNQLSMTQENSSGGTWYGMYQKQKNFSGEVEETMQSSMIWGSQYDAMLNWMLKGEDSSKVNASIGNHSEKVNTGITSTDVINNIYDLSGNLCEFTLEAYDDSARSYRGGCFKGNDSYPVTYEAPASYRAGKYPHAVPTTEGEKNITSRISLYIK